VGCWVNGVEKQSFDYQAIPVWEFRGCHYVRHTVNPNNPYLSLKKRGYFDLKGGGEGGQPPSGCLGIGVPPFFYTPAIKKVKTKMP